MRGEVARGATGRRAIGVRAHALLEEELGDLLFAVVNLCRKLGVHPSLALDKANVKFAGASRGRAPRRRARYRSRAAGLEELDGLWDEVKREHVS